MWIERTISKTILSCSEESPTLVLVGARQTGKTSILQNLFKTAAYVTLDDPLDAEEAEQNPASFLSRIGSPVLIDEVQYAPSLFRHLKKVIDAKRDLNGRYFLTGSQRFEMMKEVSESLAGRIRLIELLTLSLQELQEATGLIAEGEQLLKWIVQGGFPEIHGKDLNANRFFRSYLATYVERDVRKLINIRSSQDFGRFLRLVASRTGQLISANALASDLGVSAPTVREWLNVLNTSQIISLVEPWYGSVTQRTVKTNKLFFLDTGLCCHLLNIENSSQLIRSPFLGAIFETHVFSQMYKSLVNHDSSKKIYFFRDHDGHEIDFVVPHGSQFHLIECKWSENPKLDSKNIDAFRKRYSEDSIASISICCSRSGIRRLNTHNVCDSVDWSHLL